MHYLGLARRFSAGSAIFVIGTAAYAGVLDFNAINLGGGLFRYQLILNNIAYSEPLSGLNILNANTVFGLDNSSTISAPIGWSFFAPLPPVVDELNYFSLSPATDIPIGSSLSGFSFVSSTIPSTVGGQIGFDVIGGISGRQLPIPEPSTLALFAIGVLSVMAMGVRLKSTRRMRSMTVPGT
jgi:hypothetical protein